MLRELKTNEMEMVSGGEDGPTSGLLHVNGGPGISMMDNPDGSNLYEGSTMALMDEMDMALQGYVEPSREWYTPNEHCHGMTQNESSAVSSFVAGATCAAVVATAVGTAGAATPVAVVACGAVASAVGYGVGENSSGEQCHSHD